MNTLKYIYTYLFSAGGLAILIISGSFFLIGIISIPHFSGEDAYIQSFDQDVRDWHNECVDLIKYRKNPENSITSEELPYAQLSLEECNSLMESRENVRSIYDANINSDKVDERRIEVRKVLNAIPWMVIGLPVFLIFNGMRKRLEVKNK
jgi:hypothetical protein